MQRNVSKTSIINFINIQDVRTVQNHYRDVSGYAIQILVLICPNYFHFFIKKAFQPGHLIDK